MPFAPRCRSCALVATIAVLGLAGAAEAQPQPLSLAPSARVRVTMSSRTTVAAVVHAVEPALAQAGVRLGANHATVSRSDGSLLIVPRPASRTAGRIVTISSEILTFVPDGSSFVVSVPRALMARLEVGQPRSRARQALNGLLIGAPAGLLAGLISEAGCDPEQLLGCWPEAAAAGGALLGGAAGATVGAVLPPRNRWVTVDTTAIVISDALVADASTPPARPGTWNVGVGFGQAVGGPTQDLEHAMTDAGFGDTSPPFFGDAETRHPFSDTGFMAIGLPVSTHAGYQIRRSWQITAFWHRTPIGETLGYQSPGKFLFVDSSVSGAGVLAIREFARLRLGAGPGRLRPVSSVSGLAGQLGEWSWRPARAFPAGRACILGLTCNTGASEA